MASESVERANCWQCRHFHITWDPEFPYGCMAMDFKSRRLPVDAVRESSGQDCLYFQPKSAG